MVDKKPLTKSDLVAVLKEMEVTTKKDINVAIKTSEKRLKKHFSHGITQIAKDIITTSETLHNEIVGRLDDLELNTVKRGEFEALKRKVERYHPAS